MYRLVIGNRNYSSWSLRAWLAMTAAGIGLDAEVIPLDEPETAARIRAVSPAGRVPVLIDGDLHVWESLAIIEYLAERHPDARLWPAGARARAVARAIASEMHAGFAALRGECPMNIRRKPAPHPAGISPAVADDISRIREIWRETRAGFGAGGPFLFGAFSAADAMFAPVVSRFHTYAVALGAVERAYADAVLDHPGFRRWRADAEAEPWTIAGEEVE